jgi:hypothetical protein
MLGCTAAVFLSTLGKNLMRLFVFLMLLIACPAVAQEDKKVMEPINLLFDAMKKGDSAAAHKVFLAGARLYTVGTAKTGKPFLRKEEIAGFLKAIGTPHKEVWNELIWAPKIEIDGNFAQAWVSYGFYVDKTFSHCGIDAFHLFKDETGTWKIFHLADTRQKEGCTVPKEVTDQMK